MYTRTIYTSDCAGPERNSHTTCIYKRSAAFAEIIMSHFALVPHGAPVETPHVSTTTINTSVVRRDVLAIYETYATMYPNPLLSEEKQERDRLSRAVAAASHAVHMNPLQPKSTGLFGFLWGSKSETNDESIQSLDPPTEYKDDGRIHSLEDEITDDDLCGTNSLDVQCIPPEAHALARFHLASTRTHGERPNAARPSWEVAGGSVLIIAGLGEVVEFTREGEGRILYTSDREDLKQFVSGTDAMFNVAYVRSATIGHNLLAVSWGFSDGLVVFYRRLLGQQNIAWAPVAFLSAAEAVEANIGDVFLEETGSALLRVTDLCPLVFEMPDAVPAACLAVSRLGGYIELVTLPPRIWFGPEIELPASSRKSKRRKGKVEHYAASLRSVVMNSAAIVALTTSQCHIDCICLGALRTSVPCTAATWDHGAYPDGPPSQFILAATGYSTERGGEMVSFWSVTSIFPDDSQASEVDFVNGFRVMATLTESIRVGSVGPDLSVIGSKTLMNLWRKPHRIQLREDIQEVSVSNSSTVNRVTSISVSAPVVSICFTAGTNDEYAFGCFLDWNGGVTLTDCVLLYRYVSQSLSPEQHELLLSKDEDEGVVPLTKISASRAHIQSAISSGFDEILCVTSVNFVGRHLGLEDPLLAVCTSHARLKIIDLEGQEAMDMILSGLSCKLLQCSFAGLLLASTSVDAIVGNTVSTAIVHGLESGAIVRSLVEKGKYKAAVTEAEKLGEHERNHVLDALDFANKRLWETSACTDSLSKVTDSQYVIQQAITVVGPQTKHFDNVDCFTLFRSIHQAALARVESLTAETEGSQGHEIVWRLRDRLIKLGSYEILCEYFSSNTDFEMFCTEFLSVSVSELAAALARSGYLDALSVVCFRHKNEISLEVLDEISPMIHPTLYSHLLPVSAGTSDFGSFLALTDDGNFAVCDWAQLPLYLFQKFAITAAFDDYDMKLITEHLDRSSFDLSSTSRWFEDRVEELQVFGASLETIITFCRLSMQALSSADSRNLLEKTLDHVEGIRRLSLENGKIGRCFPRFESLSFRQLGRMPLLDAVALIFDNAVDPLTAYQKFELLLQPLLTVAAIQRNDVEYSILSRCIGRLSMLSEDAGMVLTVEDLFCTMSDCLSCALLSQPSRDAKKRMLRDTKLLIELVETTFSSVLITACNLSLNDFQARRLIEQLWDLYQCLPARIEFDGKDDTSDDNNMADEMFNALVRLSVLSEWPGCQAFNIIQGAEGLELDERVLKCLCHSFCRQLKEKIYDTHKASILLSALLSDISELERVCFDPAFDIAGVLTDELFIPLFRRDQVILISRLLDTDKTEWIDKIIVLEEIISLLNEVVYTEGNVELVLKYQGILMKYFPEAYSSVLDVRRSLDVVHFVNSILLCDKAMPIVKPKDILNAAPLDVIDTVLNKAPRAIISGCEEWADPDWALLANHTLRSETSEEFDRKATNRTAPQVPGDAFIHLAELLGITDSSSLAVVRYRLIESGVSASLCGAAAAICRTFPPKLTETETSLLLKGILLLVTCDDFDDNETIHELSFLALGFCSSDSERHVKQFVIPILDNLSKTEFSFVFPQVPATNALYLMQRLFYDTFTEYKACLSNLFNTLHEQLRGGPVEDTLLETISRYTVYWCIALFTRPKMYKVSAVEDEFAKAVLALFMSMVMHLTDPKLAQESIREIQGILDEQSRVVHHTIADGISVGQPDPTVVSRLVHRGYSEVSARRSVMSSNNGSFDQALQWAITHSLDADFDAPIVLVKQETSTFVNNKGCLDLNYVLESAANILSGVEQLKIFLETHNEVSTVIENESLGGPGDVWDNDISSFNVSCSESTEDTSNVLPREDSNQKFDESTRHEDPEPRESGIAVNEDQSALVNHSLVFASTTERVNATQTMNPVRVQAKPTSPHDLINSGAQKTDGVKQQGEACSLSRVNGLKVNSPNVISSLDSLEDPVTRNGSVALSSQSFDDASPVDPTTTQGTPTSTMLRKLQSPPSRASLLKSAQAALAAARSSTSPSNDERKQLIEEGRRLLQQTRDTPSTSKPHHLLGSTTKDAFYSDVYPAVHRAPLGVGSSPTDETIGHGADKMANERAIYNCNATSDSDFDDGDDDITSGDGWEFEEDMA